MEVLETFGVQPILLLAQVVNFTILLLLLKKIAYKPIMKVLDERKHKIETSVRQSEEVVKKLAETESRQKEIIGRAEKESSRIIEETKLAAKKLQEETIANTNIKIEETIIRGKEAIKLERENMADLVAETTKKILGKTLTSKDNEELVKKSLNELKS